MWRIGVLAALALAGCVGGEDIPPPRLASLSPDHGPVGIVVAVTGTGFCQTPPDTDPPCTPSDAQVYFATTPAITTITEDTAATAQVPVVAIGTVDVYLSVAGRLSNKLEFVVEPL